MLALKSIYVLINDMPSETAKAGEIGKAGQLPIEAWRQQGYPKAKVSRRTTTALHEERILNVLLHMKPGPNAAFGEMHVKGGIAYGSGISGLYGGHTSAYFAKQVYRLGEVLVFTAKSIIINILTADYW